ncbi:MULTISPECIES: hypothetical protein [Pseudanabaena]|jgi:hypothetical protein|uniref:hypothetical protein n=1 Tax=Pseudanabaena TaxID=1152 RepID=UPI00247A906D|nr:MULTISPECIES: hypothetical protein [Pseudanabaena]MEA5487164.1 hypothetical protein [Pseudanabaena sp. CCNP1317]WGS74870.1 hypothetical protein OA858_23065 [Pseudanabaena galeata CCNP1313]
MNTITTPNYSIKVEGQTIPVPPEIGSSDEQIKATLSQYFEGIKNSQIRRTVQSNGDVLVDICKQAGPKG